MGTSQSSRVRVPAGASDCGCVFMATPFYHLIRKTLAVCFSSYANFVPIEFLEGLKYFHVVGIVMVGRIGGFGRRRSTCRRLTLLPLGARPIIRNPVVGREFGGARSIPRTLRSGISYRYQCCVIGTLAWPGGNACCRRARHSPGLRPHRRYNSGRGVFSIGFER